MPIGMPGPASSRTALTRARSPAGSSPTLTLRHLTPQSRKRSEREHALSIPNAPDDHFHGHFVSKASAEELIDRDSRGLSRQVPEGHFDSGLGEGVQFQDTVHFLAHQRDARRVFSTDRRAEKIPERLDAAHARLAAPAWRNGCLAEPDEAFVGMDADEDVGGVDVLAMSCLGRQPLLEGNVDRDGLDSGDFHCGMPFGHRVGPEAGFRTGRLLSSLLRVAQIG